MFNCSLRVYTKDNRLPAYLPDHSYLECGSLPAHCKMFEGRAWHSTAVNTFCRIQLRRHEKTSAHGVRLQCKSNLDRTGMHRKDTESSKPAVRERERRVCVANNAPTQTDGSKEDQLEKRQVASMGARSKNARQALWFHPRVAGLAITRTSKEDCPDNTGFAASATPSTGSSRCP